MPGSVSASRPVEEPDPTAGRSGAWRDRPV